MTDDEIDLTDAELFVDSSRGIYVPQYFAETIKRECVSGITDEDYEILAAGPDDEFYWETWDRVLNNAKVIHPDSKKECYLHQDGDLWIVPVK